MVYLKSQAPHVVELYVPHRGRSRLRRLLTSIRQIRRQHPNLILDQKRERMNIYIVLASERELMLFDLLWPQDQPGWSQVDTLPPIP